MSDTDYCVIDSKGHYVTYVALGSEGTPYAYTLNKQEILIAAKPPINMVKPKWNGKGWEETASPDEVEAAEQKRDEELGLPWPPAPSPPTDKELYENAIFELAEIIAAQEEAIFELAVRLEETNG